MKIQPNSIHYRVSNPLTKKEGNMRLSRVQNVPNYQMQAMTAQFWFRLLHGSLHPLSLMQFSALQMLRPSWHDSYFLLFHFPVSTVWRWTKCVWLPLLHNAFYLYVLHAGIKIIFYLALNTIIEVLALEETAQQYGTVHLGLLLDRRPTAEALLNVFLWKPILKTIPTKHRNGASFAVSLDVKRWKCFRLQGALLPWSLTMDYANVDPSGSSAKVWSVNRFIIHICSTLYLKVLLGISKLLTKNDRKLNIKKPNEYA